jgi:hypothetical protein
VCLCERTKLAEKARNERRDFHFVQVISWFQSLLSNATCTAYTEDNPRCKVAVMSARIPGGGTSGDVLMDALTAHGGAVYKLNAVDP